MKSKNAVLVEADEEAQQRAARAKKVTWVGLTFRRNDS